MSTRVVRSSLAVLASLALQLPGAPVAADVIVSCDFDADSVGDRTSRGFYVESFPSDRIDSVTLAYIPDATGTHGITLEARGGAYDGPVLGTDSVTVDLDGRTQVTFFLDAPVTPGETVAFLQTVDSLPAGARFLFYGTGANQGTRCDTVNQTDGTDPPLDTHRRDHVGVRIVPEPAAPSAAAAVLAALGLLARTRRPVPRLRGSPAAAALTRRGR